MFTGAECWHPAHPDEYYHCEVIKATALEIIPVSDNKRKMIKVSMVSQHWAHQGLTRTFKVPGLTELMVGGWVS